MGGSQHLKSLHKEFEFLGRQETVFIWENWGSWEMCVLWPSPISPPEEGKPWLWWRSRQGRRGEWEKGLALSHSQRLSVKQPLEVINSPHVK